MRKTRRFSYGRRRPPRAPRSPLAFVAALDALGPAPAECNDYCSKVTVPWGMYGNDEIGDCTAADTAHALMLRTACVGQIVVPTDADVIKFYSDTTGYVPGKPETDQGADEQAICQYLVTHGFLGHRASATVPVDCSNVEHLKWTTYLFGTCRLGLNLPAYAEDQFDDDKPWDFDPSKNNTDVEGHDVPIVDYRGGLFYVVTWGSKQAVTPRALSRWVEESHAELFYDWVQKQGTSPSGFDLTSLASKLQSLQEAGT